MIQPARRALLAAAAALPACGAMPAGDGGPPLPAPTVRIGDRWRYQLLEKPRGGWIDEPTWEVVEVAPELVLKVTSRRGGEPALERFESPWQVRVEAMFGDTYRFDRAMPIVPGPDAGRSVRTAGSYPDPASGRPRRWSQHVTVSGRETVEVPAGRFDCVRIGRVITFDHPDVHRVNATRSETIWYSPQVNRWVQRELRGEYVSRGLTPGNPAEGITAMEGWLLWQLTAWMPSPMAR